jgi:hypothetical protein
MFFYSGDKSEPMHVHVERGAGTAEVTDDRLSVELDDGRTISVPLGWYPRLLHATQTERDNHRLIGNGEGIHWPELDRTFSLTIEHELATL